jgi:hypothetical protein
MSRSTGIIFVAFGLIALVSIAGIVLYRNRDMGASGTEAAEHKLPAIKVILTNGCGFEGLAKEFSDFLEDKNVDIVAMGNTYKPVYDKSVIIVRKGDKVDLQRLQRMTGIERFTEARTESALADFEIIIGRDYEQYTKK